MERKYKKTRFFLFYPQQEKKFDRAAISFKKHCFPQKAVNMF